MENEINERVQKGEMLPLMEAFYTIQGEGFHKGTAAYFVRIGGCDVGCHWCDVKESWNADLHPPTSTKEIVEEAFKYVFGHDGVSSMIVGTINSVHLKNNVDVVSNLINGS